MNKPERKIAEDPLWWIRRIANKCRSLWMLWTYPFASVGKRFFPHYACRLARSIAPYIQLGEEIFLDRDVWIDIPVPPAPGAPVLIFDDGVKVGRRCTISAINRIHFERDVVFAPQVLVMDHNLALEDADLPSQYRGVNRGGTIRIEEGCWLGYGSAIVCDHGELVIGKNSVIGVNAVVTRSVPAYSVVTGNPARVVKQFDPAKGEWVLGSAAHATRS
jgi:acetyltransferase-like isoleucine patch superfamily enzyme